METKDLEFIKSQSKEERLEYYFNCLRFPERQWPGSEALGLSESDIRGFQLKKEKEVSMKPTQKRDIVIREVVKPLMKEAGFRKSGNEWWKELEDSYLFVYLKNSRFNGMLTGASFSFQISLSGKEEIKDKISNQWIYNQLSSISQSVFLPYCGYLSPNMDALGYRIDGYRYFLPTDVPLEEICEQIRRDFAEFLLPELSRLQRKEDWIALCEEKKSCFETLELRLLRYYSMAHTMSCSKSNLPGLIRAQKELSLTEEDILSHMEWLPVIAEYSSHPYLEAEPFIRMALKQSLKEPIS